MTQDVDNEDPHYPSHKKELQALSPDAPGQIGIGLMLAELASAQGREMRDGERNPVTVTDGYSITVETTEGYVGLHSSWLRNDFYLGFPDDWDDIGDSVMKNFGAIREPRFRKDYRRSVGQFTVTLPASGERTALMLNEHCSYIHEFAKMNGDRVVTADNRATLPTIFMGWGPSERWPGDRRGRALTSSTGARLFSEPYWSPELAVDDSPDALKRAETEWYSAMEGGFWSQLMELTNVGREAISVTVQLGFVMDPANLPQLGFSANWRLGSDQGRDGWGREACYGSRPIDGGLDEIMLISANSLVPWVCYRNQPVPGRKLTADFLRSMLTI